MYMREEERERKEETGTGHWTLESLYCGSSQSYLMWYTDLELSPHARRPPNEAYPIDCPSRLWPE